MLKCKRFMVILSLVFRTDAGLPPCLPPLVTEDSRCCSCKVSLFFHNELNVREVFYKVENPFPCLL